MFDFSKVQSTPPHCSRDPPPIREFLNKLLNWPDETRYNTSFNLDGQIRYMEMWLFCKNHMWLLPQTRKFKIISKELESHVKFYSLLWPLLYISHESSILQCFTFHCSPISTTGQEGQYYSFVISAFFRIPISCSFMRTSAFYSASAIIKPFVNSG